MISACTELPSKRTPAVSDTRNADSGVTIARGENPDQTRRQNLVEAGFSPLAAHEVGYYMDVQEARFRQFFAKTDVVINRTGERITAMLPGTTMFPSDSARLHPEVLPFLDNIAKVLDEYRKTLVSIGGYTDNRGDSGYNQRLSEQRALAVGRYLAGKGISPRRLVVVGYGEADPVADNDTTAGRASNRRVELTLSPIVGG
jgi:outer membrane protein OmpA-like peptidoglycan-associated protein